MEHANFEKATNVIIEAMYSKNWSKNLFHLGVIAPKPKLESQIETLEYQA
jgi:hypothetical protein